MSDTLPSPLVEGQRASNWSSPSGLRDHRDEMNLLRILGRSEGLYTRLATVMAGLHGPDVHLVE